jgi:hypothetical protein
VRHLASPAIKEAAMALKTNKLAAATALAAAFSMLATPVEARERWGRWHHGRDRVDTGDVLAGVLILGGIAAIASAASKNAREGQERYPQPYPDSDARYRTPGSYERSDSRGMDRAADMCVAEVELRSGPVGSVEGVNRNRDGWQVSGELENGNGYSCAIGNDGRISDVKVGDGYSADAAGDDGQWSDEDYARARSAQTAPAPDEDDGRYTTAQAPDFR